jgi:hypothetical protein
MEPRRAVNKLTKKACWLKQNMEPWRVCRSVSQIHITLMRIRNRIRIIVKCRIRIHIKVES